MTSLYILVGIVIVLAVVVGIFKDRFEGGNVSLSKYKYRRRNFFMTKAEHEFYDALARAVGNNYLIFAQVHLPTLVDHAIRGQNWRAALAHINRKSVDFVLCDKAYISPKLAIELDDRSHEREDRQERDKEVERILKDAGIPLLRIPNSGRFVVEELTTKINELALK